MRLAIAIVAFVALVGGALISTSHAVMPTRSPESFAQRWAPVDAALQSGQFVVEDRLDH